MANSAQFYVSLGMQILIAIIGFYYQHRQLRAMSVTASSTETIRPTSRYWPLFAMIICGVFAWIPFVLRDESAKPAFTFIDYGIAAPFTFYGTIDTARLLKNKDQFKVLLVVRFSYSNVDRMSDIAIEKSPAYTIDGLITRMTAVGRLNPPHLRIEPKHASVVIEYNAALVPVGFSPDQINSLSDIEHLGGRILSERSQTVPFSGLGIEVQLVPKEPAISTPR